MCVRWSRDRDRDAFLSCVCFNSSSYKTTKQSRLIIYGDNDSDSSSGSNSKNMKKKKKKDKDEGIVIMMIRMIRMI
jgi:hypothetical protein